MPTKKPATKANYRGSHGELFDAIDAIGGELIAYGERVRRSAIHFPITIDFVVDDLELCAEYAMRAARRIKEAAKQIGQEPSDG